MQRPITDIAENFMATLTRHSWPGNVHDRKIVPQSYGGRGSAGDWYEAYANIVGKRVKLQ